MRLTPLVLVLILVPQAAAGPFDRVEIVLPAPRVGDLLHVVMAPDGGEAGGEFVLKVEGESKTTDRYGVERETVAVRVDSYDDGAFERAERCHFLKGGREIVRAEILAGAGYGGSATEGEGPGNRLAGTTRFSENSTGVVRFDHGFNCYHVLSSYRGPQAFREGEPARLGDVVEDHGGAADVVSAPAEETSFHGRRALRLTFELGGRSVEWPDEAKAEVVLADGLPGLARIRIVSPQESDVLQETRGFTPGADPGVPLWGDERIPDASPLTAFVAHEPLVFHDDGLPVPFPYGDAFRALVEDPRSGARAWLDAHPDAFLARAVAEPTPGTDAQSPVGASGSWWLSFRSGSTVATWIVERDDFVDGPLGRVGLPVPTHRVSALGTHEEPWPAPAPPERVLSGEGIAALARGAGLGTLAPRVSLHFRDAGEGSPAYVVEVTDVARGSGSDEGRTLHVDAARGALVTIFATEYRAEVSDGLLPSVGPVEASPGGSRAMDLLVRPTPLAVGVTSLALAALLVGLRFLVPLYTRLRRDRLLDHPVRARLYARIRAEPGIHLAALEAAEGVGKGGTKRHLDLLVRHRLAFVIEEPHFLRYFAAGDVPFDAARQRGLLRSGSLEAVYALYRARPDASLREAAKALGMSAPSVHRAKKRLEKEGLLPTTGSGPSITLR